MTPKTIGPNLQSMYAMTFVHPKPYQPLFSQSIRLTNSIRGPVCPSTCLPVCLPVPVSFLRGLVQGVTLQGYKNTLNFLTPDIVILNLPNVFLQ